jgi:hypothetical protein
MKTISVRELNSLMCGNNTILVGQTVTYGKNVYRIDTLINGVKWIVWMPYEKYRQDITGHNNSSVGWYALLRIA